MMGAGTHERHTIGAHVDPASAVSSALRTLFPSGAVIEVRMPDLPYGTTSGYFDDFSALAVAVAPFDGQANIYFTLNEIDPRLIARANNRLRERAKNTTADGDVIRRLWLPLDFDPMRPAGVSSTEEEHEAAMTKARACLLWLHTIGITNTILADSGNGAHLLIAIDLANDKKHAAVTTNIVKRCIEAVACRFADDLVGVDLTVFNAARIWKLYGTCAAKGDSTSKQPHRRAQILEVADDLSPTPLALLEKLAAFAPIEQKHKYRGRGYGTFDLSSWLAQHHLDVRGPFPWNGNGEKWIFSVCPWNEAHTNKSAYLIRFSSGAIAAGCHHNGCAGKKWHDLRDTIEPGGREWWNKNDGQTGARSSEWEWPSADESEEAASGFQSGTSHEYAPEWPQLDETALYGLAGEVVKTIDPFTEADPVAVLLNILSALGNCINASAHARVQHDNHPARLFVVQVGDTSKGRKGTGWSTPRYIFSLCDPDWSKSRVKSGLSSGEGLIYNVRDERYEQHPIKEKGRVVGYETVRVDEGESDKRLLIVEPEFASVLTVANRDGNTLSETVRQAWDTGNLSPLTKSNPIKATNAHISIIGHITRQELLARLDDTAKANGFANRFFWVLVRRSKELPEGGAVPDELLLPLVERLTEVITFSRTVSEVKRDDDAKALWAEVYHELSEGKPGLLGAVLSRAEAQVLRLSVIYALLDKSNVVKVEHLSAALAVWEYCERSAVLIFGQRLGDPTADRILESIRNAGGAGMSENDIYELFGKHKSANERTRAVNLLLSLGLIKAEKQETGGRPRTTYSAA